MANPTGGEATISKGIELSVFICAAVNAKEAVSHPLPSVPLVPLAPFVPLVPLVPFVPFVPFVPLVPLSPAAPLVTEKVEVEASV
jgi:hypothetical protein